MKPIITVSFSEKVSVDSSSVPSTFESQPRASAADCPSGATVQGSRMRGPMYWWFPTKCVADDLKILEDRYLMINEPSFIDFCLHIFR